MVLLEKSSTPSSPLSSSTMSELWHNKIDTQSEPIRGNPMMPMSPNVTYRFSLYKFLSSLAGWTVIGLVLLSVWFGYFGVCAEKRLRQKTGLRFTDLR
jgi:hypothetical protein